MMNKDFAAEQMPPPATNRTASGSTADTVALLSGAESTTRGFNRFLYENLLCNVESQIENWNRSAVRDPNPEVAHTLWLKAEGLIG